MRPYLKLEKLRSISDRGHTDVLPSLLTPILTRDLDL